MVILTEISQQSSSSSSSSSSIYDYDVFLSFRGADTRCNFTDHLLKALHEASIKTFFDDSEIQIGKFLKPELQNAIKSSRASVIILSKNYASSTWCLDELALIMEQEKTSNHIVFPIFYHVKPSDVRKQRNTFGDAMDEHKLRLDMELNSEKRIQLTHKMEKWEKALTEVADLKGEEANGRRETLIIERIVKDIIRRLQLDKRSKIPLIIGMEESVMQITSFLKDGCWQGTNILTIWGMAGIGKTHLANYVFQLHHREFERSCFLEDIEGKCTKTNGLLDLQKQLLKDTRGGSYMDINNVNEGTFNIENSLSKNRTFLVLDGISKFEQLDMLIGTKGLHPGSKIIITSKNKSLTEKCGLFDAQVPLKHTKHWLRGLNSVKSLHLLSWHAFGSYEPNEVDKKYAEKVVNYCQGHPLALKVLGSSLRNEDATWEDILESLGKEINPDISKVLKISFDTLPSEKDKELFKHIACLFVGEDRNFTEEILKACGICKSSGFKILINRCLLTVDSSNDILMMHQLLQEMGKDIVRQESIKLPRNRSILWHHEECLDVLQNRQGTSFVQAFSLNMRKFENETSKESISTSTLSIIWCIFSRVLGMCSSSLKTKADIETLALSEMRNLRLLQLNYVQFKGSFQHFPQGLRWLCMHGFPLSYIPSDLQMDNMVGLDLSNSKLQQLWKKSKQLSSLKFLNLSSCDELVKVGNFCDLPLLERLTLAKCTSLVEVCESIGTYCQKLDVLDLSECSKLKVLPRSIGYLKNLTQLLLDGCSNLCKFQDEIKADKNSMKSHGCFSSIMVVRSLSPFPRSLVKLSLKSCKFNTESFPKDHSSLSMLRELNLDGNPIDSMPDFVRSLSRLEKLSFEGCRSLKTILHAPIRLNYLMVKNCRLLKKITFQPEKSALPFVGFEFANSLTEIQGIFKVQALSEIDEEILRSLGWINVESFNHCGFVIYQCGQLNMLLNQLQYPLPAQMLYEHGIFSTYLQGQEVPKWFTHRSNGSSSFTLQSSPKNGKIRGINVCVVLRCSQLRPVREFKIKIRNLTKNSSWTYEPMMRIFFQGEYIENGDEVLWLSHWMFGKSEFEDGDVVSISFRSEYYVSKKENVMEYGMSLVYDDDDNDDDDDDDDRLSKKEDPLAYYKSWKHIIGGDLSEFEVSSNQYLLKAWNKPSEHVLKLIAVNI